jgi:hypothetical protein
MTFSIMTFSIMTFSIMTFSITIEKRDTQPNEIQHTTSSIVLNVIMLS